MKYFLFAGLLLVVVGGLVLYEHSRFNDGKLHVVFCNVGQGDAIFIRTPEGKDILVDAGPGDRVLSCLSSHMPFWDRSIELAILTHPHADHMAGFVDVLERYSLLSFATEEIKNKTALSRELEKMLANQNIPVQYVTAGANIDLGSGVGLRVVGPSKQFLALTSPGGFIGETSEFGSVELLVSYGTFSVLLTGDSQASQVSEAITTHGLSNIDVLQVPHHGSKTGLTEEILLQLKPTTAVVSVGKNRYGHPNPTIIDLLRDSKIQILRTDINGEVEAISDGKNFVVN